MQNCLLPEALLFQLKMHHKPFGGQALPGSASGASYSAPIQTP